MVLEHLIHPVKTESEIGLEIVKIMLEEGLEANEMPLVQSGPNSAIPHSTVGSRVLRIGDIVVVDASAPNKAGYYADFTRTYCLGRPNAKQKEVFATVKEAEAEGVKTATSGIGAQEIDLRARGVIERAGYGKYFVHRTGHGLGLEVHEPPYIREGNADALRVGMVFTVEPGIYLPGKFGVRIEDNIVLENNKATNLTPMSHDLIEL
jgi:Xaa-Pro aminopeptidase